jgi:hypothetical protein
LSVPKWHPKSVKITNIVAKLSKQEKIIKNTSNTDKYPVWKLTAEK